jgi:2-polyprenyl-3-methyl-5-hydroxy-6-metoxy-1,4-benzoquinol methylase
MVDVIGHVVQPARKIDRMWSPNTRVIVSRLQRYTVIWFRFLGLRKASALGSLEPRLRR